MRHYEIVFIVHPDQSEQVPGDGRALPRRWSPAAAARSIASKTGAAASSPTRSQKMHKAHYVLMNIECDNETLTELEHAFKFNDAVLRHLIVKMDEAVTAPSPMMKEEKSRSLTATQRGAARRRRRRRAAPRGRSRGAGDAGLSGRATRSRSTGELAETRAAALHARRAPAARVQARAHGRSRSKRATSARSSAR